VTKLSVVINIYNWKTAANKALEDSRLHPFASTAKLCCKWQGLWPMQNDSDKQWCLLKMCSLQRCCCENAAVTQTGLDTAEWSSTNLAKYFYWQDTWSLWDQYWRLHSVPSSEKRDSL